MATRKIVPRADNEGGLGTALKRWASAFINALTADSATIGTLSGIVKAAAGVLSATALGAANLKFFMNAAGTGPEWANGIKIGSFTRDTSLASGTQEITGVGFKPSNVLFFSNAAIVTELSIGIDNSNEHFCFFNAHAAVEHSWYSSGTVSIELIQSGSIYYTGYISTFGEDGFTMLWTKTGEKTGTGLIYYLAFR